MLLVVLWDLLNGKLLPAANWSFALATKEKGVLFFLALCCSRLITRAAWLSDECK